MATPQDKLFFAVREVDGKEWIDVNAWGYVAQTAIDFAKRTDEKIPNWAKKNPVKRIGQFNLIEIKQHKADPGGETR